MLTFILIKFTGIATTWIDDDVIYSSHKCMEPTSTFDNYELQESETVDIVSKDTEIRCQKNIHVME